MSGLVPPDPGSASAVLSVRDLCIDYVGQKRVRAVDGVTFDLRRGEIFGLLGESGSGKSTAALGALRVLPPPAVIRSGQVLFEGVDLLRATEAELRRLRSARMSVVLQSAMNALSPVLSVGEQIADVIAAHEPGQVSQKRVGELLELVGIPADRSRSYPHELSGGMRQRVGIAMALALRPALVVLDEPTTALDVLVEREILQQVLLLKQTLGFSVLLVSHDVGTMLEFCDRLGVLYAGRLCEVATRAELLRGGRHPYTRALLAGRPALPTGPGHPEAPSARLAGISGTPPDLGQPPVGCRYHPRCTRSTERCRTEAPELVRLPSEGHLACHEPLALTEPTAPGAPLAAAEREVVPASGGHASVVLAVRSLAKMFRTSGRRSTPLHVVSDVSFDLNQGEVLALVGQSGSGKSTILRMLAGLEQPSGGEVSLHGEPMLGPGRKATLAFRKRVQIVLQDPFASLNPAHTVAYQLERPLLVHRMVQTQAALLARQQELLELVGLAPATAFLAKYPHELSGGQRQRVAIARALAVEPDVILADEPTSMLDVSVRMGILNLLSDLRRQRGLSLLYVTHDLASAGYLADRMAVLSGGSIVEEGPTARVLAAPRHDTTQRLLAAATHLASAR